MMSSFYRWAVSVIALLAFKFTVDKALSIWTAFARIKYVRSTSLVVPGKTMFYLGIARVGYRYGSDRSALWLSY